MQLWSQPVYGLKVSLLRHVHRGESHGSNGVSSITMCGSFLLDLRVLFCGVSVSVWESDEHLGEGYEDRYHGSDEQVD